MFWKAGCSPGGSKDTETKNITMRILDSYKNLKIYSMGIGLSKSDYYRLKKRENVHEIKFLPRSAKKFVYDMKKGDVLVVVYGGEIRAIGRIISKWDISDSKEHVWPSRYKYRNKYCYSLFRKVKWLAWFDPPLKISKYPSIYVGRNKGLSRVDTIAEIDDHLSAELLKIPEIARSLNVNQMMTSELKKEDRNIKKVIENRGMNVALCYEKRRAKGKPVKDVSKEFLGYDIESFDRYVEVKSFATTGPIILTENEWETAIDSNKPYWIYVVENILVQDGHPKLSTIPFNKIMDRVKVEMVSSKRYVIEEWKNCR